MTEVSLHCVTWLRLRHCDLVQIDVAEPWTLKWSTDMFNIWSTLVLKMSSVSANTFDAARMPIVCNVSLPVFKINCLVVFARKYALLQEHHFYFCLINIITHWTQQTKLRFSGKKIVKCCKTDFVSHVTTLLVFLIRNVSVILLGHPPRLSVCTICYQGVIWGFSR